MQPSEALTTNAQIAVTLAGFAGVVVAFRNRSVHEWSRIDKFRLQILLTNSAAPFVLSIFAMVLLSTSLDAQIIWRLCSLFTFIMLVATGSSYGTALRRFSPKEFKARSEEHTSELQSRRDLVCRLLLEKKKKRDRTELPAHSTRVQ